LVMAGRLLPERSFSEAMASLTIAAYGGCTGSLRGARGFAAGFAAGAAAVDMLAAAGCR